MPTFSTWIGWGIAAIGAAMGLCFSLLASMEADFAAAESRNRVAISRLEKDVAVTEERLRALLEDNLDQKIKSICRDRLDDHQSEHHR